MRTTLIASAALFGVALASPAFAQDMTPEQYLGQAKTAIQAHQRYSALMAVNSAENELLRDRAAQESRGTRDVGQAEPPVIREMGRAREAIRQSHWNQAMHYVDAAMSHPSASVAGNPMGGAADAGQIGSKSQ